LGGFLPDLGPARAKRAGPFSIAAAPKKENGPMREKGSRTDRRWSAHAAGDGDAKPTLCELREA